MAIIGRSIKPAQASDINDFGVSTDKERDDAIAAHVLTYHSGTSQGYTEYYMDTVRNKNLSKQVFFVDFFYPNRAKKRYLRYQEGKASSNVPYSMLTPDDYCIVGYKLTMRTSLNGDIIELRDNSNGLATILTVNVLNDSEKSDNTLDITIGSGAELAAYATNMSPKDPLFRVFLRRIYP